MEKASVSFFSSYLTAWKSLEHLCNAFSPWAGESLKLFLDTCLPGNRTMYYFETDFKRKR